MWLKEEMPSEFWVATRTELLGAPGRSRGVSINIYIKETDGPG